MPSKQAAIFIFGAKMPQFQVSLTNENGEHLRAIAMREAKGLESTGEAVRVCRRCGRISKKFCGAHRKSHDIAFQLTALHRNIFQSPPNLTVSDSLANCGLSRKDETNHQISFNRERTAQFKIEMWPFIGDTKAVSVRPCPA